MRILQQISYLHGLSQYVGEAIFVFLSVIWQMLWPLQRLCTNISDVIPKVPFLFATIVYDYINEVACSFFLALLDEKRIPSG